MPATINWNAPSKAGEGKTVWQQVQDLIEQKVSAKRIHAKLSEQGFKVSLGALKKRAKDEGLSFDGKSTGRPRRTSALHPWLLKGSPTPPSMPSYKEDHVTEGVSFLEVKENQCRHTLRGEGRNIVYCGAKADRSGRCEKHRMKR